MRNGHQTEDERFEERSTDTTAALEARIPYHHFIDIHVMNIKYREAQAI